jgi:hypothetical protein
LAGPRRARSDRSFGRGVDFSLSGPDHLRHCAKSTHAPFRELLRRVVSGLAVTWLVGCLSSASLAASFERKDLGRVAAEADTIVVGWVREQQSRRLPSGLIVTDFTIAVDERIKGAGTGATESVTMAGGTVGEESQEIVGFPQLVAGARYVLFIGRQRVALVPFVGGHQGMHRIERDPETGEDLVPDPGTAENPDEDRRIASAHAPDEVRAPSSRGRLKLGEFKAAIRRALSP